MKQGDELDFIGVPNTSLAVDVKPKVSISGDGSEK